MSEVDRAHKKRSFYKEWIEPFLIAAVIALFIRQFVVEAFKIPSGSMIPTLQIGDHLLVNKFIYGPRIPFTDVRFFTWEEPKRGDVIVFKYPQNEDKDFIKRVVGLPGDKIQIIAGTLMINDKPVLIKDEGYAKANAQDTEMLEPRPHLFEEELGTVKHSIQYLFDQKDHNFGPITVPKESVFVMGDNRDNSQDSRYWGFVKFNKILGKALIIYWSWDGNDRWVRWERIGRLIS
jgi:signal peptidase I